MRKMIFLLAIAALLISLGCSAHVMSSRDHLVQNEMERVYEKDFDTVQNAAIEALEALDIMVLSFDGNLDEMTARTKELADKYFKSEDAQLISIDTDGDGIILGAGGETKTLRYYSKIYCRFERMGNEKTKIGIYAAPVINGREDVEKIVDTPDYINGIKHLVDGSREADLVLAVLFKLDRIIKDL